MRFLVSEESFFILLFFLVTSINHLFVNTINYFAYF